MISLSIGLPIIMALIRKLKVLQYDSYTTKSFEELREQYSGWDKFGRILFMPGDYWRGLTGPLIDFLFISTQELTGTQTAKTAENS